jgi:crotonobetainyl-CoA:carnitine CoA-transferase CaiB-like acyl-CoA transferase
LLRACDANVLKVEDPARPDGARRGVLAFFDLLNSGATSVALDLGSSRGQAQLATLLRSADVVVEGSRPRALAQLGIDVEEIVAEADVTWISITAHGRDQGDRVGYGDDAAVAGGLVAEADSQPVFVGDAVADPLTGVAAAVAAWAGVRAGGGRLVDVALSRVAAWADSLEMPGAAAVHRDDAWWVPAAEGLVLVAAPYARTPTGAGPELAVH